MLMVLSTDLLSMVENQVYFFYGGKSGIFLVPNRNSRKGEVLKGHPCPQISFPLHICLYNETEAGGTLLPFDLGSLYSF